jgi:Na+/H+-dicarboxylate symporter
LQADTARVASGLLDLLIPSNLVRAIGHNYVPAVVIFAIVYGLAIHKIERKAALLDVLNAVQVASVTLWRWWSTSPRSACLLYSRHLPAR